MASRPALSLVGRRPSPGQAYLDGKLCGVQPDDLTLFALIQNAAERQGGADLVYFVFDLLYLEIGQGRHFIGTLAS